ncbi:MAG: serine hydrolase [Candidatus Staskawiczbacteria bacterium]|nr:serine hydrolase [Candidatus Staskawiczbacteria bacterium]
MNIKRAIGGFLLSFVFLIFFTYIISGLHVVLNNVQSGGELLGNISVAAQNILPADVNNNVVKNIVVPEDIKPEINAESAVSIESNLQRPGEYSNKIIFEKESNTPRPIASLTKLMTAIIVLDNPEGSYNFTDTAVVDNVADSQDAMKQDVKLGDVLPIKSFLEIMLVESSNKAAYALSELIGEEKFVGLMNKKAKELGLQNTFFTDPTGLSSQDVSTANDLAKLAEYILKSNNYSKIAEISGEKELFVPGFGNIVNTDQLLGEIPDIVCSKTGFTTAAKGCLLLVINNAKNNNYLINVILGADDRFFEMRKLINYSSGICK